MDNGRFVLQPSLRTCCFLCPELVSCEEGAGWGKEALGGGTGASSAEAQLPQDPPAASGVHRPPWSEERCPLPPCRHSGSLDMSEGLTCFCSEPKVVSPLGEFPSRNKTGGMLSGMLNCIPSAGRPYPGALYIEGGDGETEPGGRVIAAGCTLSGH